MFNIKGDKDLIVGQVPFYAVKKDLGANFDEPTVATELAKVSLDSNCPLAFALLDNTNAVQGGYRFCVYMPGTGWKFVAVA